MVVTRVHDTGEPGYDLHLEAAHTARLRQALTEAGAPLLDLETADVLRLEAGVPKKEVYASVIAAK